MMCRLCQKRPIEKGRRRYCGMDCAKRANLESIERFKERNVTYWRDWQRRKAAERGYW